VGRGGGGAPPPPPGLLDDLTGILSEDFTLSGFSFRDGFSDFGDFTDFSFVDLSNPPVSPSFLILEDLAPERTFNLNTACFFFFGLDFFTLMRTD